MKDIVVDPVAPTNLPPFVSTVTAQGRKCRTHPRTVSSLSTNREMMKVVTRMNAVSATKLYPSSASSFHTSSGIDIPDERNLIRIPLLRAFERLRMENFV
jgi:hypothetical protein